MPCCLVLAQLAVHTADTDAFTVTVSEKLGAFNSGTGGAVRSTRMSFLRFSVHCWLRISIQASCPVFRNFFPSVFSLLTSF